MTWDYLFTFAQSNLLEIPVYFLFFRARLRLRECILIVTLANAITHPLVFFGFLGSRQSYWISTLTAEIFAPVAEAIILGIATQIGWRRAAGAALAANLFSWQLAPILTYLFFF